MKVKKSFKWHNVFSPLNGIIDVEKGAPVHQQGTFYFVHPRYFKDESIRHDAIYYGCHISEDNIVFEEGD